MTYDHHYVWLGPYGMSSSAYGHLLVKSGSAFLLIAQLEFLAHGFSPMLLLRCFCKIFIKNSEWNFSV